MLISEVETKSLSMLLSRTRTKEDIPISCESIHQPSTTLDDRDDTVETHRSRLNNFISEHKNDAGLNIVHASNPGSMRISLSPANDLGIEKLNMNFVREQNINFQTVYFASL